MSEGLNPERGTEPLRAVFGDVVLSSVHSGGVPALVFREYGNGNVEAIGIVELEDRTLYVPGTYLAEHIDTIVGHKTYEEVVETLAFAFNDGEVPGEGKLEQAREALARHGTFE